MKKLIVVLIAISIIAMSGVAMAGDTATLTVSASVTGTCKFNAGATLDFGSLDPSSTADATAQVKPTYWCTKGTTATGVTAGQGLNYSSSNRMAGGTPADFIPYSLSLTGGTQTGAGKGTPLTLTIDGTITNANYINASAGSYTDSVVLTITP